MFKSMKSENWGGIASLCGSLILMAAGDSAGLTASLLCLIAEAIFALRGHLVWGYALGCALISTCGFFLTSSVLVEGNPLLKDMTYIMMIVWAAGAARWPISRLAAQIPRLNKFADILPPLVSIASIIMRLPLLFSAAFAGQHSNVIMVISLTCYLIADILLGRLQTLFRRWCHCNILAKRGGPGRT